MSDILSALQKRRTIRSYTAEQIPGEMLEAIVTAGVYAPSSRNTQPWHLTIVQDAATIERITREVKEATARMPENHYKDMVGNPAYTVSYGAPTFIIVSADPAASKMAQADCALLLGSLFLAAHALGVGSCWINQLNIISDEPDFRSFITQLGVPEGNHIYGCGTFGFPACEPPKAPKRREGTVVYAKPLP